MKELQILLTISIGISNTVVDSAANNLIQKSPSNRTQISYDAGIGQTALVRQIV